MADITTRAGKGAPLENDEVDANFTNLNNAKLEATSLSVSTGAASGGGALSYSAGVFTFAPADLSSYVVDLSSFTTTNLAEGTNLYYTNERVDDRVNTLIQAGLGITTSYDDINNELTIESDTIEELCKNGTGSTILKGTPVYQTGTAGNAMVIAPADASSAATMPAVGVLSQDLAAAAEGNLILMGRISGVNTSAFSEGDVIYVATGGGYTNVRPTGQSVLVQNLGRVTKVDATNGGGVVMGSGRANDVPNLTNGNVFIGNAGGTYDKRAIVAADISDLTATATELNYTDGVTSNIQTQLNSKLPSSSYTAADVLTKVKTVDGTGSGLDADLLDGQHGSYYTGYTDTAIANLVDSAPATLDTLNELAAALGDDPNFATTVTNSIATKVSKSGDTITSGTNTGLTINHNTFAAGLVIERNDALNSPSITFKNTASQSGILYAPITDNSLRWRDGTSTNSSIIWHQGNDGAGSGLDADLLDGQHGSYYTNASNISSGTLSNARLTDLFKAGTEIPSGADLNTYRTTGYYSQNSNADAAAGSNYPVALAGILEVITDDTGNGSHTVQRYSRYNSPNTTYHRYYYSGSWSSWSTQWDSNNQGTGSGLDADLLDGQQGSYYAAASSLSNYLPLAGGTMTGTLDLGTQNIAVDNEKGFVNSGAFTRNQTPSGYIDIGPANTTWAHIYTDRPNFYFNKDLYVLGQKVFHDTYHPNADTLTTARTINGVSFDGSANITVEDDTKLPLTGGTLSGDVVTSGALVAGSGSGNVALTTNDGHGNANVTFNHRNGDAEQAGNVGRIEVNVDSTSGATMSFEVRNNASTGPITINDNGMTLTQNSLTINNSGTSGGGTLNAGTVNATTFSGALSGNATTATTLETARTINGVSFNGSANITVADSTKLPLTGGTLTGGLTGTTITTSGDITVSGGQVYTGTTQARVKFAVWSNTEYGIGMQSGYTFGGIANEYALTNQMNTTAGRGFWWGDSAHTNAQGAMALTTDGKLTVADSQRLGYGETDTTTPGATYTLDVNGKSNITSPAYSYGGANFFLTSNTSTGNVYQGNINGTLTFSSNMYYFGGSLRQLDAGATSGAEILVYSNGAIGFGRVTGATAGSQANTTSSMYIDTTGDVGLGTVTPTQKLHVNGTGYATTDFRAPIFYDSADTAYLVDPASTTTSANLAGTVVAATFNATSTTNGGFQGIDADSVTAPSFTWSADLNTGMYRSSTDRIGFAAGGNAEFLIYTTYTYSPGSSRAPIFYDSNNTTYYVNPASTATSANFAGKVDCTNVKESVAGISTILDPNFGGIQYKTLTANTTFTDSFETGESLTLRLNGGATYTVTWPTVTWITSGGNVAPTLNGTNDVLVFWKEGSVLYGAYAGYGA